MVVYFNQKRSDCLFSASVNDAYKVATGKARVIMTVETRGRKHFYEILADRAKKGTNETPNMSTKHSIYYYQ